MQKYILPCSLVGNLIALDGGEKMPSKFGYAVLKEVENTTQSEPPAMSKAAHLKPYSPLEGADFMRSKIGESFPIRVLFKSPQNLLGFEWKTLKVKIDTFLENGEKAPIGAVRPIESFL